MLYFKDKNLEFKEQFDAIGRLLEAARGMSFSILLGLQNDPSYWKEITARDKALRDYFIVRRAQNERIQTALLKAFGKRDDWVGYYIPDEIDDLSWRDAGRRGLLQDYLRATTKSLRDHDAHRTIAISAFFRARTAPAVVAGTLNALTADTKLDYLLIQDGAGNGDPPDNVLPLYYRAIRDAQQSRSPELWAVIEAFRQTSANAEPFTAQPAPPESFQKQIRAAAGFPRRIVFAFPEYIAPDRGPAARALYELLGRQAGLPEKMPMHHADN